MRILVVSGIWPPDSGGPASHASEACAYLSAHGQSVEVVTMADATPATAPYAVSWVPRRLRPGVRHVRAAALIRERARGADVLYATGMEGRSAVGARLARVPLVLRLPSDPAFERARWRGLTTATLDRFEDERGLRISALKWARDREVAAAARIVVPSAWLRDLVVSWGVEPDRVVVLPHAVSPPPLEDRETLRAEYGFSGPTLVLAARLVPQKSLDVALRALARTAKVALVIAGDGPERDGAERLVRKLGVGSRVRFLGAQPREDVFALFRAADAAILSSSWESFGLVVAEALAVGTPVISTEVGGVVEMLSDGVNGLLIPPEDPEALAGAIELFFADDELRRRLGVAATRSVARLAPESVYNRLEGILRGAAGCS